MSLSVKVRVQSFGRFLSNMVMPNIGAFIAWGIITAMFIPAGWTPNTTLARLVDPMVTYLLPLLIGYTGGRMAGGGVGAITTMGVIVGADMPMFMGSIIAGPFGGWAIKQFDRVVDGRIKSGFEMLVNNFSVGIIGMILAMLAFLTIGPLVSQLSGMMAHGVELMVSHNALPLTSVLVEPSKILFLNNAINHGIFSPLGIQQASASGKSIFFLIEANPGPGLGVLLAYMFFGSGSARKSAPGAAIIHFLGGIHEIYFPYVLLSPRLLIAVILGGMTCVYTLVLLHGGLVSAASPGSIIAVLAMTPKGAWFANITAIVAAFVTSFIVSSLLLKTSKINEDDLEAATHRVRDMKAQSKGQNDLTASSGKIADLHLEHVRKIIVSCDAGMGSSAMAAGVLRKKVENAGLTHITVTNTAINALPEDADLVITHRDLTARAIRQVQQAQHLSIDNFLDGNLYNELVSYLQQIHSAKENRTSAVATPADQSDNHLFSLNADNVFLSLHAKYKQLAVRFAGEQLVKGGYVHPDYIDAMLEREKMTSTYLGESIAMPHGTVAAKYRVIKTGVVFCQYPNGVRFGVEEEDIARLVIGIAARNNEHIQVIAKSD